MESRELDMEKYSRISRQAAAESCVLMKNDCETLPLKKGEKVAVFGTAAFHYYKSGLGSGGLVNTRYVVSILDALRACNDIVLDEELLGIYEKWIEENPFDEGSGWGTVPWSQKEMPVTEALVERAREKNQTAIVIIGRTAGEDQDNSAKPGSYLLTDEEKILIRTVSVFFQKTAVLLNVGNIIDMKWVETYDPAAVMYVWQGGQEGGNGVIDVLMGKVNPCGRLTDTIAYNIEDYPCTPYFGDPDKNFYVEDIYVGYRYFESCAREKVQYPFGYGLSYTEFEIAGCLDAVLDSKVIVKAQITNVGSVAGKEVVQVYVEAPQGRLGKPVRVLAGFGKTALLAPGEKATLSIECQKSYFASYDDSGVTGHKECFLLEEGEYKFYVGSNVRSAKLSGSYQQQELVLEQLSQAYAPGEPFDRFRLEISRDGNASMVMEAVPLEEVPVEKRMEQYVPKEIPFTGNQGIVLGDVYEGKASLEDFVAQLTDEELACLMRGEGMCSLKVTPGTAGAFGGLTESLKNYGIPAGCCADGPSGIRMDCGTNAFSLLNGTALGCTFDVELTEEVFELLGTELWLNKIDTLLGPGINIHRSPLNGRNFEYISEDPILTGVMCVAQLKGMKKGGAEGTIKHFCGNNQEARRSFAESVISERALREIYLKGFEIAVREGDAMSIMTTYGPVNGYYTAGSFDLCTVILREQWNFKGIVMTDWWAASNWKGEPGDRGNHAPMVIAQNDIYMLCADTLAENEIDNILPELKKGRVTRAQMQRNACNTLNFLLKSAAMKRSLGLVDLEAFKKYAGEDSMNLDDVTFFEMDEKEKAVTVDNPENFGANGKLLFGAICFDRGVYDIELTISSEMGELAQIPVSVYLDNIFRGAITFRGSEGKDVTGSLCLGSCPGRTHYISLVYKPDGVTMKSAKVLFVRENL